MANERLSDLTTGEVMDYLRANPQMVQQIRDTDPRAELFERIHGHEGGAQDIEELVRKHKDAMPKGGRVPVDVKAEARQAALDAIKNNADKIAELRTTIEQERKDARHQGFRAQMLEAGAEDADLDKIEQFMVDNEIGPKSVALAVKQYYEVTAPAEPSMTSPWEWEPKDADQKLVADLAKAGPDADLMSMAQPHIYRVFNEMTTGRRNQALR